MKVTPRDVETVLLAADNLNAALKTFLKREAQSGNSVEPFVKSMRSVVTRNRDGELLEYIEKNCPTKEAYFVILFSYAFPKVRDSVVAAVFEEYADTFNATYERRGNEIHITNPDTFSSISKQVVTKVEQGIDQAGVPRNNYSVYSLLAAIFEPDVLVEVLGVLG